MICNLKAFMRLKTNSSTQLQIWGANIKTEKNSKVQHLIMSIVKVQSITPINFRIVKCYQTKMRHDT